MNGSVWSDKRWHEIVPGLWQGGHYYLRRGGFDLAAAVIRPEDGFQLIVSLYQRPGHGPHDDTEHLCLTIPDGELTSSELDKVRSLGETVAAAVKDDRKTLVRCQAGLNRSGLVVAYALGHLGHTPADAIALIRERRSPHALFNEHFVGYLTGGSHG